MTLDTILSASEHYLAHWSTGCESNKAGRLLRYVICRLWDAGRGRLVGTRLDLAQVTIARRIGVSRQWLGILAHRLEAEGWLECQSHKLPDGTNSSSVWMIGRMIKRLLIMLGKARRKKSRATPAAKCRFHFSPRTSVRNLFFPPTEEVMRKMPLLQRWLERGSTCPAAEGHSP